MIRLSLITIVIVFICTNCGVYIKYPPIGNNSQWRTIKYNDSAVFCLSKAQDTIDSVVNLKNNKIYHVKSHSFSMPASDLKAGINQLSLVFYLSNGKKRTITEYLYMVSDITPKQYSVQDYLIIKHDDKAYTQGLIYWNDLLYESTGLKGESSIRSIDPQSGEVLNIYHLEDSVFGEGIALYNNNIQMITWKDNLTFRFNEKLQKTGQNIYPKEGWGLMTINDQLLASDGSDYLFYLNRDTYQVDSSFQVFNDRGPVYYLNELEYINKQIWANVLGKDTIVVINTENGKIELEIDVANCIDRQIYPNAGALNGIAFDKVNKTVYLTGKNWPFMLIWQPFSFEK